MTLLASVGANSRAAALSVPSGRFSSKIRWGIPGSISQNTLSEIVFLPTRNSESSLPSNRTTAFRQSSRWKDREMAPGIHSESLRRDGFVETLAVCDTEPIVIEGLRRLLESADDLSVIFA